MDTPFYFSMQLTVGRLVRIFSLPRCNKPAPSAFSLRIGHLCLGCPLAGKSGFSLLFLTHSPCPKHLSFSSSLTARHYYRGGTPSDVAHHSVLSF